MSSQRADLRFGQVDGVDEVCRLVGYGPRQQECLMQYAPQLVAQAQGFGQRYFGHLLESRQAAQALMPHLGGRLQLLADQQQKHHLDLLLLPLDEAQARHARQLGEAHARLGLDPAYFAGVGEIHFQAATEGIGRLALDVATQDLLMQSVRKRIKVDMLLQLAGALDSLSLTPYQQSGHPVAIAPLSLLLAELGCPQMQQAEPAQLAQYLVSASLKHGFSAAAFYALHDGHLLAGTGGLLDEATLTRLLDAADTHCHLHRSVAEAPALTASIPLIQAGKAQALLVLRSSAETFFTEEHPGILAAIGREAGHLLRVMPEVAVVQAEQKLAYLSHHDSLTGLPNRSGLLELLDATSGVPRWVAVLAIDGFHDINARLGHDYGDLLLLACASRIREMLPEACGVGRVGAARFLLYGDSAGIQLESLIARVVHTLEQPIDLGSEHVQVKFSGGVVLDDAGKSPGAALLRRADLALIRARHQGDSHWHYYDVAMDEEIRHLHGLRSEFTQAIAQQELALFFQPKINLLSHAVIGVEALVRWKKDGRFVAPGQFFPAIETTDLMRQLDLWVLGEALRYAVIWQQAGQALPISVNLSAMTLKHDDFLPMLEALLARHPDVAHLLEIEVLETLSQQEAQQIAHKLVRCRALGLRIALDDFGTGASSLVHLQQLPFDTIKIDQRFVRMMIEFPDNEAIIRSMVSYASHSGRRLVVEGIESQQIWQRLLELGCEDGQGYEISPPMSAATLVQWLIAWRQQTTQHKLMQGIAMV
ncbi:EAL domain-containing protein [Craterilacuibacter sp.]|uniref:EAL domain-containing protein n=1 Tax=Craterilacuibacter sp. TaxID=2870909 RepID=UPI003F368FEE